MARAQRARGSTTPWHPLTRIAFRFCFVYFGLFCLISAQITFVYTGVLANVLPEHAVLWQMTVLEPFLSSVGHHVFGIDAVLRRDSGSGDQAVVWVLVFVLLVVAVAATLIWSVLDRRRGDYTRVFAWFLLFVRLCVAGQMLFYGVAKVIPAQMPAPSLSALLQPYGQFSPASVLWLQVGSSHPYEIALGAVEVIGGLLLLWTRTATLGALISVMAMGQVFLLNMTYDVPVKILSFHLLLLSLFLLAPQLRRLANVLVLQRPAEPTTQPPLFDTERANRITTVVVPLLGLWVLIGCLVDTWSAWHEYGGGRDKPELYGIWAVTEFSVDGTVTPPLTTDGTRWQHVVFDEPGLLTYQRMNGELIAEPAELDGDTGAIALPMSETPLSYERPAPDRLRLAGELDGRQVSMALEQVDLDSFTLRSRGFNWVQEYPYFR
ncbi:DoxX family protein [Mycolicibacter heraklionensis]|uniref:DoxX family protein n=1 Tax=Mycolicibacter heraklionensis TaxID=512402 RepID=A0AA91IWB1_9MYCO|nr:DoxX family protein [Mycolicibacter heraklionensis]OBK81650.1 DoxX family protein [Mycolicibacter heraklionensis]